MHVLLIGAGFSRNWNGWLATEVMGELLGRLAGDPEDYRILRNAGNFEDALSQVQADARAQATPEAPARLERLERAILDTFGEMNRAFARRASLEFSQDVASSVQRFLSRFDIIYTLNQDLLLELHYNIEIHGYPRWSGHSFPGIAPPPNWRALPSYERIGPTWHPAQEFKVHAGTQPIFKLHGSVNWRDPDAGQLLVMGGNKHHAIERNPLLRWYLDKFRQHLSAGGTKLMAIGYSFLDAHINDILVEAAQNHGMKMHLVNPSGLGVLDRYPPYAFKGPNPLEDIPIIGVSTRPLTATFSTDELQRGSLTRFFQLS